MGGIGNIWVNLTIIILLSGVYAQVYTKPLDPADLVLTADDLGGGWVGGLKGGYYGHFSSARSGFQYRKEIEEKI